MTDADGEGFTVAVVVSERLFKDAAADPVIIPKPNFNFGPRYLTMFDHFLGLPGNICVTSGHIYWSVVTNDNVSKIKIYM